MTTLPASARRRQAGPRLFASGSGTDLGATLVVGLVVLAAVALGPLVLATDIAARLSGHGRPALSVRHLRRLVTGPQQHGHQVLGGPVWLTAAIAAVLYLLVLAVGITVAVSVYRRGGARYGIATCADLIPALGAVAARRSAAQVTRPSLSGRQIRRLPLAGLGFPLGWHARSRLLLTAPWTDCHGVIAPTQSGKTLRLLGRAVLGVPGFCLVTSTKPDLLGLTALARFRAGHPVWVFDTARLCEHPWPSVVRWSPVSGCTDPATAERRAEAFLSAARRNSPAAGGNDAFFSAQARSTLALYLLAVALHDSGSPQARDRDGPQERGEWVDPQTGELNPASMQGERGVRLLLAWLADPADEAPRRVLHAHDLPVQARQLTAVQRLVPETRDGVFATIANAVQCLTRPDVLAQVSPTPGEGFDIETAIRLCGTVYVLGSDQSGGATAPLVTAFVEEVLETARRLAFAPDHTGQVRDRLDPPAVFVLDEVANVAPLPHLPETVSDVAGRGVVVAYALQSPGQAESCWGPARAKVLRDNTTSLVILGGGKSHRDLEDIAALAGHYEAARTSTGRGQSGYHSTESTQRQPVLTSADLRQVPAGAAYLLYRDLPVALVRLPGLWQERRWAELAADRDRARQGDLPGQTLVHIDDATATRPRGRAG
jgi:type IV secretion system protein VirD4